MIVEVGERQQQQKPQREVNEETETIEWNCKWKGPLTETRRKKMAEEEKT